MVGGHLGRAEPDRQKERGGGRVSWVGRNGTSQTEGNGLRWEGLSGDGDRLKEDGKGAIWREGGVGREGGREGRVGT